MTSAEFKIVCKMLAELRNEINNLRNGVDHKIDSVAKSVKEAFQGFGILDPDEDVWTEKQVCERYQVTRKTMFNYRSEGKIPYIRKGEGKQSSIRYRKADVMEFFATENS